MELSKRDLRHIKNLSGICEFDLEKRVATVPLRYETSEDLLDEHLSRPGKPVVSEETIEYLRETMSFIPKTFSVEFALTIDDYGKYDCESLMKALRTMIENTFYYHDDTRKKDNVLAVAFLLIGVFILALEVVGGMAGWYGAEGSVSAGVIGTLLEVLVWVLIWEGAYIIFLTYANDSTTFAQDMCRFYSWRFLNKAGEELCAMDQEQMYRGWVYLTRKEIFARSYILFSNAALLAVYAVLAVELFAGVGDAANMQIFNPVIGPVLTVMLVLCNIAFYKESGKLRRLAMPMAIAYLLYTILDLIVYATAEVVSPIRIACDIALLIVLLVDIVCLRYMRRQSITYND